MPNSVLAPAEQAFLQALNDSGVRFIVVGMSAALLQGARGATEDIDLWFADLADPRIAQAAKQAGGFYVQASAQKILRKFRLSRKRWLPSRIRTKRSDLRSEDHQLPSRHRGPSHVRLVPRHDDHLLSDGHAKPASLHHASPNVRPSLGELVPSTRNARPWLDAEH
jgi:hypothetical protein